MDEASNTESTSASSSNIGNLSNQSLRFSGVKLYFFRRKQGFNCVPSRGGTTLGMAERHFDERMLRFENSLNEEPSNIQALYGEEQDISEAEDDNSNIEVSNCCEFEDDPDSEKTRLSRKRSSPTFLLDEDKSSLAELRPLPVRQRRRLLRLSGVKKIDSTERFECEAIRLSRNECGCQSCGAVCLPETCPCSVNGIACQVDKMAYPCSCTREGCRNVEGRVEFNAVRVRRHLIHTLTKIYAAAQAEQNVGCSSEDSGAVDDEPLRDDNCDIYGRCRHCNTPEPTAITSKRQQQMARISQPKVVDIERDEVVSDDNNDYDFEEDDPIAEMLETGNIEHCPIREFTPAPRHNSPAIVATKMLRRKMTRQWRQQANNKSGSNRLVSKLVLMRRAMASAAAGAAGVGGSVNEMSHYN